jgi:folate-dependent phosphoribosylglycinamide formyltransferase PurN
MTRLEDFQSDLCVLAGYMLITSAKMCRRYNMVNLHPAAPGGPIGTWQEVIWQLIDSKAQKTGALMNLVTPELDKGPVVAYCTFPIGGEPFDKYWREIEQLPSNSSEGHDARNSLFKLIRQHGLAREFPLIIATLNAFSQGQIKITKEKQVVNAQGQPIKGYNLTSEIDAQVKEVLI